MNLLDITDIFGETIENGEIQKVVARYTFVINRGRIITQHSSVNPE